MTLQELLKHHNIDWPEGATHAVQDEDGWIKFATNPNIKLLPNGCWDRGFCPQAKDYPVYNIPLASDWDTAIVSHPHSEAHPHAELMAQYAEDAAKTDKPWELYQIKTVQNIWKDIGTQFIFDSDCTYRRKPKTKLINGVEIPDISFTPAYLQNYWYPNPSTDGFCHQTLYAPVSSGDIHRAKHRLCYPYTDEGREAAILHAKAMLGVQP